MEQILINLVTGALGGVAAGKSSPTFDLGMIGNIISGLIGGGVLGQVVTLLMPAITAAAQSGDLRSVASSHRRSPEALAVPYSRRSLAQSRTKLLPDGQLDDVPFEGKLTSHGLASGLRVRERLKWHVA